MQIDLDDYPARPEAVLAVEDTVWIHRAHGRSADAWKKARVTKIARAFVYLTMEASWDPPAEKFRITTQSVDSQYTTCDYFRTQAQRDYEDRLTAAKQTLRARGIHPEFSYRWQDRELLALADFLDALHTAQAR